MQKVVGSNPISRFEEARSTSGLPAFCTRVRTPNDSPWKRFGSRKFELLLVSPPVPDPNPFDELIEATRDLDQRARAVQGEQELLVGDEDIEGLINDYDEWYARALTVLPDEFHEKFIDLYEGGVFVKRIKHFLQAPGSVSTLWTPDQESGLFSYWEVPYETTFHASLLEQRQVLTLAKQFATDQVSAGELALVQQIARGFPMLVDALHRRHDSRSPFDVRDEYDVQDVIGGVLSMLFGDVRPEDPSPTRSGASSRVDFLLKRQKIVVEVKMTREGLRDREVGNQLIQDVERYRSHPDCAALVAFVYDPARHIRNPQGLEEDLSGDRDGLVVSVLVVQG
jgi:hypothetical protein